MSAPDGSHSRPQPSAVHRVPRGRKPEPCGTAASLPRDPPVLVGRRPRGRASHFHGCPHGPASPPVRTPDHQAEVDSELAGRPPFRRKSYPQSDWLRVIPHKLVPARSDVACAAVFSREECRPVGDLTLGAQELSPPVHTGRGAHREDQAVHQGESVELGASCRLDRRKMLFYAQLALDLVKVHFQSGTLSGIFDTALYKYKGSTLSYTIFKFLKRTP